MSIYKISFVDENVLLLLEKVELYYMYVIELNKRELPIPTCVSNEFVLIKEMINKEWLDDFPDFEFICLELQKGNKLFSVPPEDQHYLYYHLLRVYKRLSNLKRPIVDFSTTLIPYTSIIDYLIRCKEDATYFFERYLDAESTVSVNENKNIVLENKNAKTDDRTDVFVVQPCQGCHK